MIMFGFAFACFLAPHIIPSIPGLRPRLIALLGRPVYLALYVAISVITFVFLLIAASNAPYVEVWSPAPGQIYVILLFMALACILLVVGLTTANNLSLSLRHAPAGQENAAALTWTRHPLIWSLGLWGFAHLLANGDVVSILLFGLLGGFALVYIPLLDRRKQNELGLSSWSHQAENAPAILFGQPSALRLDRHAVAQILIGLFVFGSLLYLHETVIGVDPLWTIR